MIKRGMHAVTWLLTVAMLFGCEEEDVVSMRVRLEADLSGSMVVSALTPSAEPAVFEASATTVEWQERLALSMATGAFTQLSGTKVLGLSFEAGNSSGMGFLKLRIPRGAEAVWMDAFVPADLRTDERRRELSDSFGNSRYGQVATTVKFVIELPAPVIGHGVNARALGLEEEIDGRTVSLVVPFQVAAREDPDILWHLTWEDPR